MWISPGGGGPVQSTTSDLTAHISYGPRQRGSIQAPNTLRANEWFHIAFITGSGGMKLFVNGLLAGTNAYTGSFASLTNSSQNWVGRDSNPSPGLPTLSGQIDEFRVWKTQRTPEQIRETMLNKLTGSEPDLVGLWNFDDPAQPGRDASPGAHHGKFVGQAAVTNAALPVIVFGKIDDASGNPLAKASVEIHQPGQPDRRINANDAGEYAITLASAGRCDLFVTTGKLSAYRLGFQSNREAQQRLDWTLAETQGAAGARAVPARSTADGKTTPEKLNGSTPSGAAATGDRSRSLATKRVLQLDGTNSFVELPSNLLDGAIEVTFEAWLKWEKFGELSRIFDFGELSDSLLVSSGYLNNDLYFVFVNQGQTTRDTVLRAPALLALHQWCHVAAVASTNGMRLYLDGRLVGTNAYTKRFYTNGPVRQAFLGHPFFAQHRNFHGDMGEVRLWKTARTQEQVRENIGQSLSGNEPDLIGLWNFDDTNNPGRDVSLAARHGKLVGQATVTNAVLPVVLYGKIIDASGKTLAGASIEVRQSGSDVRRLTADESGEYGLAISPAERCDLFVTT
ncbi:MAG: hypothetical protein DME26_20785, partial [Verrucomicrobia bacterium]